MGWKKLRLSFLAMLAGLLVVILIQTLSSSSRRAILSSSVFPEQLEFPDWQWVTSQNLPANEISDRWIEGRRYQYEYQDQPLLIDMRYFIDIANGDVRIWLSHFSKISIELDIRQQPERGYYGLTRDQQSAYLIACIPPVGKSTVTSYQYQQNTYVNLMQQSNLFNRLLGRNTAPWVDDRCLLAILSTPLTHQTESDTYIFLEQAWTVWHQWWSNHYPNLMQIRRGA